MDDATFWDLISSIDTVALSRGDEETALELLRARVADLGPAAIDGFHDRLAQALYDLDGRDHFNAAGDNADGDDAFLYARCHVVAFGRAHHTAVLANPSQMPQTHDEWCEALLYVAPEAWAERADQDPADYDHLSPVSYDRGANQSRWR